MTGFHEIRFPDNIAYGATGGPEFATTVVVMASRSAAFAARPASGMVHAADRLIVALDLGDVEQANQLVDRLGDKVSCYKIGYHLQLISGYDNLVDRLVDQLGKDVLLDTKVCDIEETVRAAVRGSVKRRAKFLTVHGNDEVTDAALQAAAEEKEGSCLKVFLVTVLTSLDDLDLRRLGYRQTSTLELAKERAGRALQFGLDGVICSGREAAEIRDIAAHCPDFIIATPGIRPDGDSRHDQKRVATPTEAIRSGADYLIVGRPVIHASDPAEAADKIINEMQHAFDSRYRCQ